MQHNNIATRGFCDETGKVKFATKADAKRLRERRPEFKGKRPYLCDSCGHHHIGGSDLIETREDHRVFHGAEPTPEDEPVSMSLRMAATELGAKDETLIRAIEAGKLDAWENRPGHWRVSVKEVARLKTLTMRSY